jgi:hypothetical protein
MDLPFLEEATFHHDKVPRSSSLGAYCRLGKPSTSVLHYFITVEKVLRTPLPFVGAATTSKAIVSEMMERPILIFAIILLSKACVYIMRVVIYLLSCACGVLDTLKKQNYGSNLIKTKSW